MSETLQHTETHEAQYLPIYEIRQRNEYMIDEIIKYQEKLTPDDVIVDEEYISTLIKVPSGTLEVKKRCEDRAPYPQSIRYQLIYHEPGWAEDGSAISIDRHIALRGQNTMAETSKTPFENREPKEDEWRQKGSSLSREEELDISLDLGIAVKNLEIESLEVASQAA